jgi:hypothetical protein
VRKKVSGRGSVRVGSRSFTAIWVYRFVQVYVESGGRWVEDFRDDSEWTLTTSVEEFERLQPLTPGDQTAVQVGRWGEAAAYFLGATPEGEGGDLTLNFSSRPAR